MWWWLGDLSKILGLEPLGKVLSKFPIIINFWNLKWSLNYSQYSQKNSFPTQSVKLCKLSLAQKKRFEAVDIFIMERNDNSTCLPHFCITKSLYGIKYFNSIHLDSESFLFICQSLCSGLYTYAVWKLSYMIVYI